MGDACTPMSKVAKNGRGAFGCWLWRLRIPIIFGKRDLTNPCSPRLFRQTDANPKTNPIKCGQIRLFVTPDQGSKDYKDSRIHVSKADALLKFEALFWFPIKTLGRANGQIDLMKLVIWGRAIRRRDWIKRTCFCLPSLGEWCWYFGLKL